MGQLVSDYCLPVAPQGETQHNSMLPSMSSFQPPWVQAPYRPRSLGALIGIKFHTAVRAMTALQQRITQRSANFDVKSYTHSRWGASSQRQTTLAASTAFEAPARSMKPTEKVCTAAVPAHASSQAFLAPHAGCVGHHPHQHRRVLAMASHTTS